MRRQFKTAEGYIQTALGSTPENLKHLRDAPRLPGLNLTQHEKLDFMLAIVPHAEHVMKEVLGENCFEPSSDTYGRFWLLPETRSFIQMLLDVASYSAGCEDWG